MGNKIVQLRDILTKTMKEMPNTFTSNDFSKKAVQNGYPAVFLKRSGLGVFISEHAVNEYKGSKTWTKKSVRGLSLKDISDKKSDKQNLSEIKQAINLLKKNGYKILKPVTKWKQC